MRPVLRNRETLVIFDRGHQMTIATLEHFEAVLAQDLVAFAEREGRKPDIPSFAEWGAGPA